MTGTREILSGRAGIFDRAKPAVRMTSTLFAQPVKSGASTEGRADSSEKPQKKPGKREISRRYARLRQAGSSK
jgi:hypothetical protein